LRCRTEGEDEITADGTPVGGAIPKKKLPMHIKRRTVVRLAIVAVTLTLNGPHVALAKSDPSVFSRYCSVCHSIEEGKNKFGPSLAKIVGRRSASIQDYAYSEPMKKLGVVWTSETLDKYLTNPAEMVPGTRMAFPGIKNQDERKALIDYLAESGG
jgi:cytochrome c